MLNSEIALQIMAKYAKLKQSVHKYLKKKYQISRGSAYENIIKI